MRQVLAAVDEWRNRIEHNPLHGWLSSSDDNHPPEQRLWFALYFINFIMYFRELNLYHISYEGLVEDQGHRTSGRVADALTDHASEDMTHSRLFMRDFRTLNWDDMLHWRPSEVFHWLFTSRMTEDLRRRTIAITRLCIEAEDPAERFAVVEAIEACGHALFRHCADLAAAYTARTGKELVYWGAFHLAKETGHVAEDEESEDAFRSMTLTPAQRNAAIYRATRVFELIDEQNRDMLRLAQETISQGGFRYRSLRHNAPDKWIPTVDGPELFDFHFWPGEPHPSQRGVLDSLHRCVERVNGSAWMQYFEDPEDLHDALRRLRVALLFTATDTTSTPSVYKYMVPYEFPSSAQERALNRLASRFGRRAPLLYIDWETLGLDELLQWSTSRTLRFIYLDRATESHRDLRATVTHYIDSTTDPVLRYWTIVAVKTMTSIYAEPVARLATRVEQEIGRPLPYLSLKLLPDQVDLEPDPEADAIRFERTPVTPAIAQRATAIVEDIYQALQHRIAEIIESAGTPDYRAIA